MTTVALCPFIAPLRRIKCAQLCHYGDSQIKEELRNTCCARGHPPGLAAINSSAVRIDTEISIPLIPELHVLISILKVKKNTHFRYHPQKYLLHLSPIKLSLNNTLYLMGKKIIGIKHH